MNLLWNREPPGVNLGLATFFSHSHLPNFHLDLYLKTDYINMESLPKLLVTILNQLLEEKDLNQWNVQANGDTVYVNLKFTQHGQSTNDSPPSMPGWRRKSPSERRRDSQRLSSWQSQRESNVPFVSVRKTELNSDNLNTGDSTSPFMANYSQQSDNGKSHVGHGRPAMSHVDSTATDSDDLFESDPLMPDQNKTHRSADRMSTITAMNENPQTSKDATPIDMTFCESTHEIFYEMQKGTADELKMSQTSDRNYHVCDKPIICENPANTKQCEITQYEVDMDKLD